LEFIPAWTAIDACTASRANGAAAAMEVMEMKMDPYGRNWDFGRGVSARRSARHAMRTSKLTIRETVGDVGGPRATSKTMGAVRSFQQAKGLPVDSVGYINMMTVKALGVTP
jgi:hypothetical protein